MHDDFKFLALRTKGDLNNFFSPLLIICILDIRPSKADAELGKKFSFVLQERHYILCNFYCSFEVHESRLSCHTIV